MKNVYFAQYGEPREGGRRRVVLKRPARSASWRSSTRASASGPPAGPAATCSRPCPAPSLRASTATWLLTPEAVEGWSDLVHCPSQRLPDRLVRRYAETKDSGSLLLRNLKDSERMQLLLTLAFNPEPLVLQVGAGSAGSVLPEGPHGERGVGRSGPPAPVALSAPGAARRRAWKKAAQGDPGAVRVAKATRLRVSRPGQPDAGASPTADPQRQRERVSRSLPKWFIWPVSWALLPPLPFLRFDPPGLAPAAQSAHEPLDLFSSLAFLPPLAPRAGRSNFAPKSVFVLSLAHSPGTSSGQPDWEDEVGKWGPWSGWGSFCRVLWLGLLCAGVAGVEIMRVPGRTFSC